MVKDNPMSIEYVCFTNYDLALKFLTGTANNRTISEFTGNDLLLGLFERLKIESAFRKKMTFSTDVTFSK